jgi:DNA-binding FrmR family transcriptional regulator
MNRESQKKIINRFRRIEGQLRGLQRLVKGEAPCLDILTQVSAVTAAVKNAGAEVIQIYMEQCMSETSEKSEMEKTQKMEEFRKALSRYIKMA